MSLNLPRQANRIKVSLPMIRLDAQLQHFHTLLLLTQPLDLLLDILRRFMSQYLVSILREEGANFRHSARFIIRRRDGRISYGKAGKVGQKAYPDSSRPPFQAKFRIAACLADDLTRYARHLASGLLIVHIFPHAK
jgi:hypothetical protein